MRLKQPALWAVIIILLTLTLAGCGPDTSKPEATATPNAEIPTQTTEQPEANDVPAQATEQTNATEAPAVSVDTGFEVGQVLPDFSVPMAGGGTFTLSENLGKPVFINLFATWCPPCVGEMPEINQLYGELGDQVSFIIIDIGEDEATAQDFINSNGYSLPTAWSEDGAPFGTDYLIQSIPQTFILKADGTISAFFNGSRNYDIFNAAIEEAKAP
jgi:thiol-disulfide isomerase/thioredoxin